MKIIVKYKFFGLKKAVATDENNEIICYSKNRISYGHFATKLIYDANGNKLYTMKMNNYMPQRMTTILDSDKNELGLFSVVLKMTPEFSFIEKNGGEIRLVLNSTKNGFDVVKNENIIGRLMPAQKMSFMGQFEIECSQNDVPFLFALGIACDVFRRDFNHL